MQNRNIPPSSSPFFIAGRWTRAVLVAGLGAMVLLSGCATTDAPWPDRVVDAERMQVVGRLRVQRPMRNFSDPVAGGTTMLRLHVDESGHVRRIVVTEGSGDAGVDAAAVRGLTGAVFVPYRENGVPVPVTVLMPVHFKASSHCRGLRPLDC